MHKLPFLQKKNCCRYFTVLFFLFILGQAEAQKQPTIYRDSLFRKNADTTVHTYSPERPYYIATWEGETPESIKVIRQLDENLAIIEIDNPAAYNGRNIKIAIANDHWKFSSIAEQLVENKNTSQQKYILTGLYFNELLGILEKIKGQLTILSVDEPSHSVLVRTSAKFIKDNLLSLKEVIFIDLRAEPHTEIGIIGYNRSFHGLNAVDYAIPGANGKNIVAGVKEQKMEEADLDLYKRVLPSSLAAPGITNHATVISSIIGGAGNSFYDGRGIAYGCKFFSSSFANLFADDAAILNTNKVTVQNHSYGTIIQQFYGAEAVSYDAHAWGNKTFVHVFSAGNMGSLFATDGKYANIPNYANLTGNFKMAKNIITVGAIDNAGNIATESSAGPIYDRRLAPQIIALGPNGTSDAAAIVSGTIAVMQQVYADSNSLALPPASLIKAILYNSADDIFNKGIDYKTGYGLLNSYSSIKTIQQREYDGGTLTQAQQWTKTIAVPANAAQLKVTLSWTDNASIVNNNKALLNDLDLEVQELGSGIVYKPWVLNATPNIDSLAKQPTRKRDSLNTAEQVSIALPVAGNYQIKVIGTNILTSSLSFNIAYHTDTLNTFYFTSPQHASDINKDENPNADIRWRAFVADTNQTGNIYISYNNGVNWQLLKASHKIYSNFYQWPIKDTNSIAQIKMETSFGDFFSKSFIISKLTRINVDFVCADSFGLSWNKHIYANGYKIYTLTDSPYLKHIFTVTDTFVVLKRSQYPSLVYAVEPLLSNALPAARSIALDIPSRE
ncbi:MAG: S8 family serine peptidase [Bacteroidota bacterium]